MARSPADQRGEAGFDAPVDSWSQEAPATRTTPIPLASVTAIRVLSRDHASSVSVDGTGARGIAVMVPVVASIIRIWASATVATDFPSGDHFGHTSGPASPATSVRTSATGGRSTATTTIARSATGQTPRLFATGWS